MATLATILFGLSVLSLLSGVLFRVRRARQRIATPSDGAAKGKRGINWSDFTTGVFLTVSGFIAAVSGETETDAANVSGPNVRIAGAFLFVLGLALIVYTISKRNEVQA